MLAKDNYLAFLRKEYVDFYTQFSDRDIIIFGAGSYGRWMIRWLRENRIGRIVAIADNNNALWGKKIDNIKCDNITILSRKYPTAVVIVCSSWQKGIYEQLKLVDIEVSFRSKKQYEQEIQIGYYETKNKTAQLMNFFEWFEQYEKIDRIELENKEEQILNLLVDDESKMIIHNRIQFFNTGDYKFVKELPCHENQYFGDYGIYKLDNQEIFVDCGAYIGDTISDFLDNVEGYSKIYAFEPDEDNCKKLKSFVADKGLCDIYINKAATGSQRNITFFSDEGTSGSRIAKDGNKIVVVKLDDEISDSITLLKMDVEGAELASLKGAKKLITTYHPKLAICLYHRPFDWYDIISYVHELCPEYKIAVRHHSNMIFETVMYAWI